jgi:hypothetical protein
MVDLLTVEEEFGQGAVEGVGGEEAVADVGG